MRLRGSPGEAHGYRHQGIEIAKRKLEDMQYAKKELNSLGA